MLNIRCTVLYCEMQWKLKEHLTLQSDWSIFCSLPLSHAGHTHAHKAMFTHSTWMHKIYCIYSMLSSCDIAFVSKHCFANCHCWCVQWDSNTQRRVEVRNVHTRYKFNEVVWISYICITCVFYATATILAIGCNAIWARLCVAHHVSLWLQD